VPERILRQIEARCQRHETELRQLIARAVKTGVPSAEIAAAVGISRATLWRRYGTELRRNSRGA